ncbi:hypothetical protein HanXRQr2_Chr03g0107761 [Helianthus annuus]|uniref:Gag-polypeptide of LTR copia-type n=1 Tax=Helianthus annuus TaxID=4232 RepID=A0A9K3JFF7_HELAN|nr:hypothetical protein HanXRQr2_Chr03g0107761 [Helianthus annuus]
MMKTRRSLPAMGRPTTKSSTRVLLITYTLLIRQDSFVDGSIPKPEKTGDMYMPWMRCDAMIKGWLTNAMEKEIRGSVKYANTAAEIWKDLQERFEKESAPRAYELKQSLTITRQEGSSVSAYYTKLRGLWVEIQTVLPTPCCTCGHNFCR